MRRVRLQSLKGNETLARSIFDEEGRVLLREGVTIRRTFIEKLLGIGIVYAYIEDEISKGIEVNDVVSEETRQETKKAIAETVKKFIRSEETSLQGLVKSADQVIDDILGQKEVLVNLMDIRTKEDLVFSHSVNVCVLAVITGINMGYSMSKLKELAVGALLHDIGLVGIMKETIPGTGKFEIDAKRYFEHPKLGYDILNKQQAISSYVKVIALTHHERCDGTGFPLGLKHDEIHEMVRIVAVCNAFDHIMHGNKTLYDVPAYHAIEFLQVSANMFDIEIVKKFVNYVSMYPSGLRVKLSTGENCIVIRQNKGYPSRPVVRVLSGHQDIEIDLSKALTIFVEEVFES